MSEPTALEGLPVPTKEKVTRWMFYGGTAALAIGAVNTLMPSVLRALGLLINGVWSFFELGVAAFCVTALVFAIGKLAPLYRLAIESVANKLTWKLFEYDPVTPLEMWLNEVSSDRQAVEQQEMNVDGVVAENEKMIGENTRLAAEADRKFKAAVRQYTENSQQARLMALEAGRMKDTAENIRKVTEPLIFLRSTLHEIVEATQFTERAAQLDVQGLKQEWKAAKMSVSASDSAYRVISGRSEKKKNAMRSMEVIHSKYAQQFGRLRSLRRISQEVLASVDVTKGMYQQEALDRLRQESQFVIGVKPSAAEGVVVRQKEVEPARMRFFNEK